MKNNEKWYVVDTEEREDFLSFAKGLGCRWIGGSEICPQRDDCSTFMCIFGNTLAKVPFVHYLKERHNKLIVEFVGGRR